MPLPTPPLPYEMMGNPYMYPQHSSRPAPRPRHQSQYKAEPQLSTSQPGTSLLRKKHSAWSSALNVNGRNVSQPVVTAQAWQSTVSLPARMPSGPTPQYLHRPPPILQSCEWCDEVATTLNDALSVVDGKSGHEDVAIDSIVQRLSITGDGGPARNYRDWSNSAETQQQPKSKIINFKKTWLYANSRLPPRMLPFKVYIPTWQILCQAADASLRVYSKPVKNEKEEHIAANRDERTKAMVLKSVTMDEKNLIVFAIRGSKWNRIDWAINLAYEPEQPVGFLDDQGNACHAGFLRVARAMVRPVAARLRQLLEQNPSRTTSSLVITGHSAGGAVASLLYMHMMSKTVESELNILSDCFRRVHCVTFGAPPVALLPLQKPNTFRCKKSIFTAFINEGDPVARIANKEYVLSLARLIAAPAPPPLKNGGNTVESQGPKHKISMPKLKSRDSPSLRKVIAASMWSVPEVPLSNAARLVLLRTKPHHPNVTEAVSVTDDQLRDVVFGDPAMHSMELYERRVDALACAAVTGRSNG